MHADSTEEKLAGRAVPARCFLTVRSSIALIAMSPRTGASCERVAASNASLCFWVWDSWVHRSGRHSLRVEGISSSSTPRPAQDGCGFVDISPKQGAHCCSMAGGRHRKWLSFRVRLLGGMLSTAQTDPAGPGQVCVAALLPPSHRATMTTQIGRLSCILRRAGSETCTMHPLTNHHVDTRDRHHGTRYPCTHLSGMDVVRAIWACPLRPCPRGPSRHAHGFCALGRVWDARVVFRGVPRGLKLSLMALVVPAREGACSFCQQARDHRVIAMPSTTNVHNIAARCWGPCLGAPQRFRHLCDPRPDPQ